MQSTANIRALVDQFFELQWCRDNLVAPLGIQFNPLTGTDQLTVAIANVGYLATIGEFIKTRAKSAGLSCQFIEQPQVSCQLEKRQMNASSTPTKESKPILQDDAVLEALKEADLDSSDSELDFDDTEDEEQILLEQGDDLSAEMLGSKIHQAAAKLMISAQNQRERYSS